ncbi:hypothetical protein KPSA3_00614 [Pseudomonas syringae pv. actinidiae]|uniref:Uncharacterized protein n=1 Tax=Pseudomonas syringae pv. actinidiae TaxID=103796 RepID=A0AAN4Q2Q7_PSESF|nr:hypothetical protein KPSA3_00614 [Pseudomonas syringae pv. actinidiae]
MTALSASPRKSVNYLIGSSYKLQAHGPCPLLPCNLKLAAQSSKLKAASLRHHPRMRQPGALIKTEQDVHVLHCLTGRTFNQIVDNRQHDNQIATLRAMHRDAAHIGTTHTAGFGMAARWHHVHKRLIGIALLEQRLQVHRAIGYSRVERGMNATNHRHQMRNKRQTDITARSATQALGDFRQMTMAFYGIGLEAFVGLRIQRTNAQTTPGTADAGFAVGNQASVIGNACFKQWQETQLGSRWVAARHSNEPRVLDLLAIDFRQPVNRILQQFRRPMRLAVPLGPLDRVLQTEVGRQVNHFGAGCEQLTRQSMSNTMRRSEEHHVTGTQGFHVRHAECQAVVMTSQVRVHVGDWKTGLRARGDNHDFCLRMLCQQTQQLDPGVTRAADDTDLDHNLPSTKQLESGR